MMGVQADQFEVVGYKHHRGAALLTNLGDSLVVERFVNKIDATGGFIQQQQLRPGFQRQRQQLQLQKSMLNRLI